MVLNLVLVLVLNLSMRGVDMWAWVLNLVRGAGTGRSLLNLVLVGVGTNLVGPTRRSTRYLFIHVSVAWTLAQAVPAVTFVVWEPWGSWK